MSPTSATALVQRSAEQVPRGRSRELEARPRAATEPFRQADHGHHAAAESGRVPGHGEGGGRQHVEDHPVARRHGDRPQAAAGQVVLLRRRRRDRGADPQGQRRVLRLPAAHWSTATTTSIDTKNFAEATDANGQVFLPIPDDEKDRSRASTNGSRPRPPPKADSRISAFTTSGGAATTNAQYNEVKTFAITDRPVYRPEQTVQFKFWISHAQYDRRRQIDIRPPVVRRRDPQSQGREGLQRNTHVRQLRRHRRQVRAARRRHARASISSSSSITAAARSASRSTRSPSSR